MYDGIEIRQPASMPIDQCIVDWDDESSHLLYVWVGGRVASTSDINMMQAGCRTNKIGTRFESRGFQLRVVAHCRSDPHFIYVVQDGPWSWVWVLWYGVVRTAIAGLEWRLRWTAAIWGLLNWNFGSPGDALSWRSFRPYVWMRKVLGW